MDCENWMKNLNDNVINLPLNLIAIPGSHDSFTCDIEATAEIGPDVRPGAFKFMNYSGYYGKCFMRKWVMTQSIDAITQLSKGLRYFDLRVGMTATTLCITHQLFSGLLEKYLQDINTFLDSHEQEVVLLDFNHIYLEEDGQAALSSLIFEIFGSKIVPYNIYNKIPTLKELWFQHHQVFVFFNGSICNSSFWPSDTIPTFWPNTTDIKVMIDYLNKSLREKEVDKFHISQGILTPVFKTLVYHPFSSLQHHLADKATTRVTHWLSDELSRSDQSIVNIVIADFVHEHDFIDSVLKLNINK